MNATRWDSLDEYIKWLGREGICKVDHTQGGFFIAWIDKSMSMVTTEMKKEKKRMVELTEEERDRKAIERQIGTKAVSDVLEPVSLSNFRFLLHISKLQM